MRHRYTREQVWEAVKTIFNPALDYYEINGEELPISNSAEDEEVLKEIFFDELDDIAGHKNALEIKLNIKTK